jgi:hypothetical protein
MRFIDPDGMWVKGADAWNAMNEQFDKEKEDEEQNQEQAANGNNTSNNQMNNNRGEQPLQVENQSSQYQFNLNDNQINFPNQENIILIDQSGTCPFSTEASTIPKVFSKVAWGETQGLYPTKTMNPTESEIYNPSKWDPGKLKELQKARAAIDFIYNFRNHVAHKSTPDMSNPLVKRISKYCYKDEFPDVDAEIKNNSNVKWFYLGPTSTYMTNSIDQGSWNATIVKYYGPFYNVGGGDAQGKSIYILFYSATKK